MPVVMIDQDSDSDATIVQLSFGDRLGALIDTVKLPLETLYVFYFRITWIAILLFLFTLYL